MGRPPALVLYFMCHNTTCAVYSVFTHPLMCRQTQLAAIEPKNATWAKLCKCRLRGHQILLEYHTISRSMPPPSSFFSVRIYCFYNSPGWQDGGKGRLRGERNLDHGQGVQHPTVETRLGWSSWSQDATSDLHVSQHGCTCCRTCPAGQKSGCLGSTSAATQNLMLPLTLSKCPK